MESAEYLALLNSMSTFAAIFDREGRLRFINRLPLLKSLGYSEEDVIGTPLWECMHFKHVASDVKSAFERALCGESVQIEVNAMNSSGNTFPMILNISPLRRGNKITGVVVEGKSVVEERRYQQYLKEVLENMPECVLLLDKDGKIIYANKAVLSKTHMSDAELCGISYADIPCYSYSEDVRKEAEEMVRKVLSGEHVVTRVRARSPANDEERTILIHAAPVHANGEISGAVITAQDITDIELMTEKLKRTHQYYKHILNSMHGILIVLTDTNGRILYINKYAEKLFDVSADEIEGMKFEEAPWFTHAEHGREHVRSLFEKALHGEVVRGAEFHIRTKDGEVVHLLGNALPYVEGGEVKGVLFVAYDITEKKRMEEKLHDLINKLKAAQEELMTPVVQVWDRILALPIIGVVDSYRAQRMTETLLRKIMETHSEIVIIDITGVSSMDTEVANHIIKTVKAADMLGCTCIITGVRPEVAQTIVHLGIDLSKLNTDRDMQAGLKKGLEMLGYKVVKDVM